MRYSAAPATNAPEASARQSTKQQPNGANHRLVGTKRRVARGTPSRRRINVRVYKFLDAHFGMKSLYENRLKISQISELNDPFELIPFELNVRAQRWALQESIKELSKSHGMLCFSAHWHDPVVWAHYSDKHRGLCLGFEIRDDTGKPVTYVPERLPFPDTPTVAHSDMMLWTKYSNWEYEQEIRSWAELREQECGIYYKEFGDDLRLTEVIAGARCALPLSALMRPLGPTVNRVSFIKARAGFKKFEMVQDQRGFRTQEISL
jgi:hypothetical protein